MEDKRALQLIKESGVLNPNTTLKEILSLCEQLSGLEGNELYEDTFVQPRFIYKHK
ncbi:hypothetical protein ACPCHU_15905 [Bacillus bombysepticus]